MNFMPKEILNPPKDDLFACVTFTPGEITTSDIIIINAKRVNVFAQFDHLAPSS